MTGKFALRIAIDWRSVGKDLAFYVAVGAFMAITNPFGASQATTFLGTFLYWTALIVLGGVAGRLGFLLAEMFRRPAHWIVSVFFASATSAFAVATAIYAMALVQYGSKTVSFSEFPRIYALVFVIAAAISSVAYLFDQVKESHRADEDTASPAAEFLERLPVKYRTADLYAVSSEDHYLRVHTSLGEEMILMRLVDAVRELSRADGLQTHRSWWVARDGVSESRRNNGKLTLILKSGTEVPVSRTYAKAVKEAALSG